MSLATLNRVQRSRLEDLHCQLCAKPIPKGSPYLWWKFRFGGKRVRCVNCAPEAWERESNPKRQALMQANDAWGKAQAADTPDDAAGYLLEARDYVQSAIDDFQSALDGWSGTGLEYSENYANFENAVTELEEWVYRAEDAAGTLEEWDPEQVEDADGSLIPDEEWETVLGDVEDIPDVDF